VLLQFAVMSGMYTIGLPTMLVVLPTNLFWYVLQGGAQAAMAVLSCPPAHLKQTCRTRNRLQQCSIPPCSRTVGH
jgi:hypothetical protein